MSYDIKRIISKVHEVFGLQIQNHFKEMEEYSDDQLAGLVSDNDSNAFVELAARYFSLIKGKAARYRSSMLDLEDLCQEGLMGLLNAARSYDAKSGASFRTYAGVCINNRIIMACRTAASQKNLPMNNFVSLSDDDMVMDMADCTTNPETVLIDNENLQQIRRYLEQSLSELEQNVLVLFLGGSCYSEIAEKLGITSKAADNALQRVRLKLKRLSI
ncbi:MAG TPA: sigma-70 family RNA polymerase sigma factor [Ruminiclostridium sp.]|nr:sigma-70 family RNA polymerase sigma factor [Ruminiclostridium sp.]